MAARRVSRRGKTNRLDARIVRRSIAIIGTAALAAFALPIASADGPGTVNAEQEPHASMRIRLTIDGEELFATLDDNATARDFLALLPLTLTLTDYNRTEKVSDLPGRLSTEGAPDGIDPAIGDITYYSPWGNLALFYRDFGYAPGLVRLGRIEAGIEVLNRPGPLTVTLDRVE